MHLNFQGVSSAVIVYPFSLNGFFAVAYMVVLCICVTSNISTFFSLLLIEVILYFSAIFLINLSDYIYDLKSFVYRKGACGWAYIVYLIYCFNLRGISPPQRGTLAEGHCTLICYNVLWRAWFGILLVICLDRSPHLFQPVFRVLYLPSYTWII